MVLNRTTGSSERSVRVIKRVPRAPALGVPVANFNKMSYLYMPVYVTNMGGLLSCQDASSGGANGSHLWGQDDEITIVDLNEERRTVVSGNYSGCLFKVFKTTPGHFVCMHIYNPGQNTGLLQISDRYIQAQNGTEIATIGSAGLVGGGINSVWFICEMVSPDRVAISRMQVDTLGHVVRQNSGVYPGVNFDLLTLPS